MSFVSLRETAACESGLGMEDGRIPDNNIIASSKYSSGVEAYYGRLNRQEGSWTARTNNLNQWIQVDLSELKHMSGVITQGRNSYSQWVTKFVVQYSTNGETWSSVTDVNGQQVRIFTISGGFKKKTV